MLSAPPRYISNAELLADILVSIFGSLLFAFLWCILLVPAIQLAAPGILILAAFRNSDCARDVSDLYSGMVSWWIGVAGNHC